MKQLSLPISSRAISTIFKSLVGLLIFGGLVGVFMYYYFVYTKDSFAEFFPSTTKAYISLKLQPSQETNDLIQNVIPEIDFQEALKDVIKQSEGSLKSRTLSFGLVPMEGKDEILMIFDQPLGFSSLIMEYANKKNWSVYKANYGWTNNSQLIITSNPKVYELVSEIVVDKQESLSDNLTNELALNSAISQSGSIYLNPQYLIALLKSFGGNPQIFTIEERPYIGGIRSIYPNLVIQSDGYNELNDVFVYETTNKSFNIGDFYNKVDRKQVENFKNQLESVGLSSKFDDLVKLKVFNSFSMSFLLDGWIVELSGTNSKSYQAVTEFFQTYLASRYLKPVTVDLPDKTQATMFAINNEIAVLKNDKSTSFEVPGLGTKFEVVNLGERIEIRALTSNDLQKVQIKGCKANISNDYLYLSNPHTKSENFVLKLAKNIFISTYPQTYPQFIICSELGN